MKTTAWVTGVLTIGAVLVFVWTTQLNPSPSPDLDPPAVTLPDAPRAHYTSNHDSLVESAWDSMYEEFRIVAQALHSIPDSRGPEIPVLYWELQWGLHNAFWKTSDDRVDMRWLDALEGHRPVEDLIRWHPEAAAGRCRRWWPE